VSAQGQYAGQYFGDYFGQAGTPVVPGVMVGSAHISLTAFGVLTDGQAPAPAPARPSYWSDRPWRDVPFIPITPRRPRRRRQEDLIFLGR
jgi:hypothetical protein